MATAKRPRTLQRQFGKDLVTDYILRLQILFSNHNSNHKIKFVTAGAGILKRKYNWPAAFYSDTRFQFQLPERS
jgi:hypothetical protein